VAIVLGWIVYFIVLEIGLKFNAVSWLLGWPMVAAAVIPGLAIGDLFLVIFAMIAAESILTWLFNTRSPFEGPPRLELFGS
jgi:hypothetical protein